MSYPSPPMDQEMLRGFSAHWLSLRSFLGYIWRDDRPWMKLQVVLTFIFMILGQILLGVVPLLYKWLTDSLTSYEEVRFSGELLSPAMVVIFLLLGVGSMRLLQSVCSELSSWFFNEARVVATRDLAVDVFAHLHRMSMRFHIDRRTGGLARVIERGVRSVEFLLTFVLLNTLPLFFQLVISLSLIGYYLGVWISFFVFLTLCIYIWFTFKVSEWRMGLRREMNNLDTDANAKAVDSLINFETVRYFTNEKYEVDRFSDVVRAYNGWQIRVVRSLSLLNVGQSFILAVSLMVVSFVVVFDVLAGKKTVGDFVMLNMYLLSTFSQLGFLGTIYRQIRQSLTDMEDLFSLLREGVEVRDAEDALDLELVKGEVLFDGVKFSYGGERVILEDFSLLLGGRKKLAVVGPSGSGKTTLSRLLLRFYDVGEGRVEIDGQDVRKVTQESLRSYVGIVPQDTVLFNGTIGENIGYGRIGASEEEILEAAERARLGELLKELPDGLETMVGERGLKLSGGEKQRVAIARILLRNPPIVIFDEATSSLDTDTERAIMESLSELAEGRTTLMIAHRLATVADADVIVVMDKGRIVEEGTHEILLSRGGLYAKMWEAQRGLEEMERKKEEMKDFVKVT